MPRSQPPPGKVRCRTFPRRFLGQNVGAIPLLRLSPIRPPFGQGLLARVRNVIRFIAALFEEGSWILDRTIELFGVGQNGSQSFYRNSIEVVDLERSSHNWMLAFGFPGFIVRNPKSSGSLDESTRIYLNRLPTNIKRNILS